MAFQTCTGATMTCSFGMAPGTLTPTPRAELTSSLVWGSVIDHIPIVNISGFGACMSLANPTVASATAAAQGVLTPMPCIPVTPSPWVPGAPTVLVENFPVLDHTSMLSCDWGGVIQFVDPGQATHLVP